MELGINNNNYSIQNNSIKGTSPNFKGVFSNLFYRNRKTLERVLKEDSFIKNPDVINIRRQSKLSEKLELLKIDIGYDNEKEELLERTLRIIKKEEANDVTMFIYKVLDFTKNNIDKVYSIHHSASGLMMNSEFKEIYTLCKYLLRHNHEYTGAAKGELQQRIKAAEDVLAKYILK